MRPGIEYPTDWTLSPQIRALLQQMLAGYEKVILQREFTEGQSGTHVLLAIPYRSGGVPELPLVLKLGPAELIEQEWTASHYTTRKLPGFVEIVGQPHYLADNEPGALRYGGLRYEVAGQGLFPPESLRDYCRRATAADLWKLFHRQLFPQLRHLWQEFAGPPLPRKLHASYDRVLPVNLLLEPLPPAASQPPAVVLNAGHLLAAGGSFLPAPRTAIVRLEGFVVTELERHRGTVTLNLPLTGEVRTASFRLRLQGFAHLEQYRLGEPAPIVTGRVVATRQDLLLAALPPQLARAVDADAATLPLPGKPQLQRPNPLQAWPSLLQAELPMKIGTVHGDLNLGNVLIVAETGVTQIIDCAQARRDHTLYDLLRLETETLLYPLAAALFQAGQSPALIDDLYGWLHELSRGDDHASDKSALPVPIANELSALQPAFVQLTAIRRAVRDLLAVPGDWREYYTGLALCLIGALKFASLNRVAAGQQPKELAFWGAATLLQLLTGQTAHPTVEWTLLDLNPPVTNQTRSDSAMTDKRANSSDNRSGGVYFEGNQSVQIGGDVVSGGTVNKTSFHGPVTGPVHTGSGQLYVNREPSRATADLAPLFAMVRQAVADDAPEAVRTQAVKRIGDLEEAIPELDLDLMASVHTWFQRHAPSLVAQVLVIIQHPSVAQAASGASAEVAVAYRQRFGR